MPHLLPRIALTLLTASLVAAAPTPAPPAAAPKPSAQALQNARRLPGHSDGILALAFSPDSKLLASASADHSAILWDPATGKLLRRLEAHRNSVKAVAFSPDGRWLLTGDVDGHVVLWNTASWQIERLYKVGDTLGPLAFLPDSRHFVSTDLDQFLSFWNVDADDRSSLLDTRSRITEVFFTAKGKLVLGQVGAISLWNSTDTEPLRSHTRPKGFNAAASAEIPNSITGICETADGNLLFSDVSAVWRWNLADDSLSPLSVRLVNLVASLHNDRYYTGFHNHQPWFRDADPEGVSFWLSLPAPVHALAPSPDKSLLAVALGGDYGSDVTRWLWAGPTDLYLIPLPDIDTAFTLERNRKLNGFPARRRTDPSAKLDFSSLPPPDAPILPPWK